MGGGGVGADPATTAGRIALGAPVPSAPIVLMCWIGFGRGLKEPRGALRWLVLVDVVFGEFGCYGIESGGGGVCIFFEASF